MKNAFFRARRAFGWYLLSNYQLHGWLLSAAFDWAYWPEKVDNDG